MVKYHVAKVIHEGEENAKALLPYIREADVVCPESALSTVDISESYVRAYSRNLGSNNRTKLRREVLSCTNGIFMSRLVEDCWRNDKPILCQEWWSSSEYLVHSENLGSLYDPDKAIDSLRDGDFDKAHNFLREQYFKGDVHVGIRDKHIAEQALLIPTRLREFYGINYFDGIVLFVIGADHRLEQTLVGETKVTVMDDLRRNLSGVVSWKGDASESYANRAIAQIISWNFRGRFGFIPEEDVLKKYSRSKLEALVKRINDEIKQ